MIASIGSNVIFSLKNQSIITQKNIHSLVSKTSDFASRLFFGTMGTFIPLAMAMSIRTCMSQTMPTQSQFAELGLYLGGIGGASAMLATNAKEALHHGLQFGAVAQITSSLGGIGRGESWKTVNQIATTATSSAFLACGFLANQVGQIWNKTWSWLRPNQQSSIEIQDTCSSIDRNRFCYSSDLPKGKDFCSVENPPTAVGYYYPNETAKA